MNAALWWRSDAHIVASDVFRSRLKTSEKKLFLKIINRIQEPAANGMERMGRRARGRIVCFYFHIDAVASGDRPSETNRCEFEWNDFEFVLFTVCWLELVIVGRARSDEWLVIKRRHDFLAMPTTRSRRNIEKMAEALWHDAATVWIASTTQTVIHVPSAETEGNLCIW